MTLQAPVQEEEEEEEEEEEAAAAAAGVNVGGCNGCPPPAPEYPFRHTENRLRSDGTEAGPFRWSGWTRQLIARGRKGGRSGGRELTFGSIIQRVDADCQRLRDRVERGTTIFQFIMLLECCSVLWTPLETEGQRKKEAVAALPHPAAGVKLTTVNPQTGILWHLKRDNTELPLKSEWLRPRQQRLFFAENLRIERERANTTEKL
jgi:hypothetical protein